MTAGYNELTTDLAHMVGEAGRAGLHAHPVYGRDGFVVKDENGEIVWSLSVPEIEKAVRRIEDDEKRSLVELRLGVGAAESMTSNQRMIELAHRRGRASTLTRADRDFLKIFVAQVLLRDIQDVGPSTGAPNVSLDAYSRNILLPPAGIGVMTQIDRRVIRPLEPGVTTHRVHVVDRWAGGGEPAIRMLGGVDFQIEHQRGALDGLRYDIVFKFAPPRVGETVELLWQRDIVVEDDPTAEYEPHLFHCTPQQPIREANITVRLTDPDDFSSCYAFQDIYENDRHSKAVTGRPVRLQQGVVSGRWNQRPIGRTFGLKLYLRPQATQSNLERERRSA